MQTSTISPQSDNPAREVLIPPESASTADSEARAPVAKPEASASDTTPIVPQPVSLPKPPPQSLSEPANSGEEKTSRAHAEANLAQYVGRKIDAELAAQLFLDFQEGDASKTSIALCFNGPQLVEGHAAFASQVIAALKEHPAFAPLYAHQETTPTVESHAVDKAAMVHISIRHLTPEQHASIIGGLQASPPAVATASLPDDSSVAPQASANDNAQEAIHPATLHTETTNDNATPVNVTHAPRSHAGEIATAAPERSVG